MEKVTNTDGEAVEVVTGRDLLQASGKLWGWVISIGIGLLVATTAAALSLNNRVDNLQQYGTAPIWRMQKTMDSLVIVVSQLTDAVRSR